MEAKEIKDRLDANLVIGLAAFMEFSLGLKNILESEFANVAVLQARLNEVSTALTDGIKNLHPVVRLIVNTAAVKLLMDAERGIQPTPRALLHMYHGNAVVCIEIQKLSLELSEMKLPIIQEIEKMIESGDFEDFSVDSYISKKMIKPVINFYERKIE